MTRPAADTGAVAVVVPVYRNGATLDELRRRLDAVLDQPWVLRLVVDACPAGSGEEADRLAAVDARVHVTQLSRNVGQHRAIAHGLQAEPDAAAWACLDGDLQDPPEAIPMLLASLEPGVVDGVFAGRRGAYESRLRRWTGDAHRRVLAALTPVPVDAGAFFVMSPALRERVMTGVLERGAPSVVVAAAASRLPLRSVPVERAVRTEGASAWTPAARLRQSARTLAWAVRVRLASSRARA